MEKDHYDVAPVKDLYPHPIGVSIDHTHGDNSVLYRIYLYVDAAGVLRIEKRVMCRTTRPQASLMAELEVANAPDKCGSFRDMKHNDRIPGDVVEHLRNRIRDEQHLGLKHWLWERLNQRVNL